MSSNLSHSGGSSSGGGNSSASASSSMPSTSHNISHNVSTANVEPASTRVDTVSSGLVVEQTPDGEWTYDPNEPRYCICNQVSYGDMVACDNEAVSFFFQV